MALLEKALRGIDDQQLVVQRAGKSPALQLLVAAYTKETENDATLPVITEMTVGRELKESIALLDVTTQLNVLKAYNDCIHGIAPEETTAQRDKRRFVYWFLKALVWACFILLGAVVTAAYKSGVGPDNHIVTSFLGKTTEIIRFVFSPGTAPVK